jgi:diacylglycerol kinase family enzyme
VTPLGPEPLPVDADGEYLGEFARVVFGVEPGALRVVS